MAGMKNMCIKQAGLSFPKRTQQRSWHGARNPYWNPQKTGRDTVLFTESIVEYNGTWYLHYGVMDKVIGVATYRGSITDSKKNL